MASYERVRVKLIKDLTQYNHLWTVGQLGWTLPGRKFTIYGDQDHYTAVEFDNGTSGDIRWDSLETIDQKTL
jgi:hypothetical protein